MQPTVSATMQRWARASNRRRFAEEILFALTWVAIAALIAAGIIRFGGLVVDLGWLSGERFPSRTAQWAFAAWAIGWVAKLAGGRALWRYRKRRIRPKDVARWLDQRHGTDELWTTALAVEEGEPHGLAESIQERARAQIARLREPVEPFREPVRTIAGIGVAAAVVALLPSHAEALARRQREPIPERTPAEVPSTQRR